MAKNYDVGLSAEAKGQLEKLKKSGQRTSLNKVFAFLQEIESSPRSGTGKPKPMRHKTVETWSRKINSGDRFVYEILEGEEKIQVTQVLGHYEDR